MIDIFLPVRFYWARLARWLKSHPRSAVEEAKAAANGSATGGRSRRSRP